MPTIAKYKYLGLSTIVEVDYPEPQVKLALYAAGSPPTYPGIDRFGRVVDHRWVNYGASPDEDIARIQHGYDRNSNRLWRQNDVARALSKKFDQQYVYDGLNRLIDAKAGLLDGSKQIIGGDLTFEQQWSLDYVGNWSCLKQDGDGDGDFDLQQTRMANSVNEVIDIGAVTGPVWTTPQYDAAGNTINFPKSAAPTESFTAVYDAWNRMVKVIDDQTDETVQENDYDGRNFRIIKKSYDEGELDETRHAYFTSRWQEIEVRIDSSSDAERQFLWGTRYVDDLILRDRDTTGPLDGTLDEQVYAIQDPNWNVCALINQDSSIDHRCEYATYGELTQLSSDFSPPLSPSPLFDIGYKGYHNANLAEAVAGILECRMRWLHVLLGRFLTRDSLGQGRGTVPTRRFHIGPANSRFYIQYYDGANLYQFVRSSPPNFTDPSGLLLTGFAGCTAAETTTIKTADAAVTARLPAIVKEWEKLDSVYVIENFVEKNRLKNQAGRSTTYTDIQGKFIKAVKEMEADLKAGIPACCKPKGEGKCDDQTAAYVPYTAFKTDNHRSQDLIVFCPLFFTAQASQQAKDVLHELSHYVKTISSDHHNLAWVAKQEPSTAIRDAQFWELFQNTDSEKNLQTTLWKAIWFD